MSRLDQQVFQALPDPAFLLDRRGTILDLNTVAERAFPSVDGAKGRLIQQTHLGAMAAELVAALEDVLARRAVVTLEHAFTEAGATGYHEVRLAPLGQFEVLALIRDVTEARLAEKSLQESDAQFRVVTQNITDAFWIRSPDMSSVQYVSPAFEKIWGRSVASLLAEQDRPAVLWRLVLDADGALLGGLTIANVRRGVAQAGSLGYWLGQHEVARGSQGRGKERFVAAIRKRWVEKHHVQVLTGTLSQGGHGIATFHLHSLRLELVFHAAQ